MIRLFYSILILLFSTSSWALKFALPAANEDVFGHIQFAQVENGDNFPKIAEHYDVGFYELVEANPGIDPDHPPVNTVLVIPTRYILPPVPREGIVINLGEMRLFYFPKGKNYFYTYPVGIGKEDWGTPLGVLAITQKIKNPVWVVPDSIYEFRKAQGDPVPHVMPSGPENPLGYYAMRLSKPTYLIHDTDDQSSVGRRSSAGCIHLYSKDIKPLFEMTALNTPVRIINEPYLLGWHNHQIYLEAHLPLEEQREALQNIPEVTRSLVSNLKSSDTVGIEWNKAFAVTEEHMGLPIIISSSSTAPKSVTLSESTAITKPEPRLSNSETDIKYQSTSSSESDSELDQQESQQESGSTDFTVSWP